MPGKESNLSFLLVFAGIAALLVICAVLYRMASQRKKLISIEHAATELQRQRAAYLEKVVATQREIMGHSLDLKEVMKAIVERTQELIGAEGSIVEMLENDKMVYHAASGLGAPHIGLRLNAATSFSGLCMRENTVLKCADSETDPRVDKMACRKVGLRSMIVVPLRHHGNAVGVLKVLAAQPDFFTQEHLNTLELMAGLLSAALSDAVMTGNMRQENEQLLVVNSDLEKLATTDGMTGLLNHRTFQMVLQRDYDLAARHKKPLSMLMMDVDFFKKFNDSFGHPAGDVVLKRVAAVLKEVARRTDCAARYGGEEFVMVLAETPIESAMQLAERIKQALADITWEHRQITLSIGISAVGKGIASPAELIKAADKALYAAKEKGRNCAVRADAIQS